MEVAGKFDQTVSFRDEKRILLIVDRIAKNKGTDRSALYREAMRFYLAEASHLTDQEKKDLARPKVLQVKD